MSTIEDELQSRLESLEAGVPESECAVGLPPEEAELLRLAASLRRLPYPVRSESQLATQRAAVVSAARRLPPPANPAPRWAAVRAWLRGHPGLATAAVASLALLWLAVALVRRPEPVELAAVTPGSQAAAGPVSDSVAESLPAESAAGGQVDDAQSPGNGQAGAPEPAEVPVRAYIPLLHVAAVPDAVHAGLQSLRGLVEVQQPGGEWEVVTRPSVLASGQRLRTGPLSSASLLFYDGSQAAVGPESELSLDEIDAQRPAAGFRTVVLTQWRGESWHTVQFRHDTGSRYEVRASDGRGVARGTRFQVSVDDAGAARYVVTEGRVDVSGDNRTVAVIAGQMTRFDAGAPPVEPVFRVTGEGVLSAMGATWTVAGQDFVVNEDTVILGAPQLGDRVRVEGYLPAGGQPVAELIVLLADSPPARFTLTGVVEAITDTRWTVAGQSILANAATVVAPGILAGDLVRVTGLIQDGGGLLAESITLLTGSPGLPFQFAGIVQSVGSDRWTISGITVSVDAATNIEAGIVVGDRVRVRGWIRPDSTWLATEIALLEETTATFIISGPVSNMNPWVVAGIPFEVREWTRIEPGIQPGDVVRVRGRILPDGTWVATDIERLALDDDALLQIVFVGTVDSLNPWVVSGLPLQTDADTLIDAGISQGDLVRVTARIMVDGTWLALRIQRLGDPPAPGCVTLTAVVVGVNGAQLQLSDGQTVTLDDQIEVTGELRPNVVVLIVACVDDAGVITIISITVIYDLGVMPPPPPPPPPPPTEGDRVTICHKPGTPAEQTKTLPRSALGGHLGHGDILGPCP